MFFNEDTINCQHFLSTFYSFLRNHIPNNKQCPTS